MDIVLSSHYVYILYNLYHHNMGIRSQVQNLVQQMGRNLNWTAYGKQAQFTAIFDRPTMVSGMEIYYTYGLDRVFPIKLEASMDGKNWTEVFSGKSSQQLNVYRWKPFKMRYLRYVGNGAENSPWTSVERISFQVR